MPTTKSALLRAYLEKALRTGGWLPLKEDDLRKLCDQVGSENLSPNARRYLQKHGFIDTE